jgi:mannose-6-phosphate isomerase-like protein (cupin superfamily)
MKRFILLLGAACLALVAGSVAVASSKLITVKLPAELTYSEARPGVQRAVLWGDPGKGQWGGLALRKAGFAEDWHTHSNELRLFVVSGVARLEGTSRGVVDLEPQSYVEIPAHVRHRMTCTEGADCSWLVLQPGRYDMLPEGSASMEPPDDRAMDDDYYFTP